MNKRLFDILLSFIGLVALSPLLLILCLLILLFDGSPVFFSQSRVGLSGKEFMLLKFRTMHSGSESKGQLSVGARDSRVTDIGQFLRKTKLDELPQLSY